MIERPAFMDLSEKELEEKLIEYPSLRAALILREYTLSLEAELEKHKRALFISCNMITGGYMTGGLYAEILHEAQEQIEKEKT